MKKLKGSKEADTTKPKKKKEIEMPVENTILLVEYTTKEWERIYKNISLLIDTREKENSHITNVLDKQGLKYISRKLEYGDYSFQLEEIPELNIPYIDFSSKIAIERKAHLNELSNNLTHKRKQFIDEIERAYYDRANLTLLIENNTYEDILRQNYMSKFEPKSYVSSLLKFKYQYGLDFIFINNLASANFIYNSMKMYLRHYLKGV